MAIPASRRRPLVGGLLIIALLGAGVGVHWFFSRKPSLPGRDSPIYREYVEAFQIGVAALEGSALTDSDLAYSKLTEAIRTIPGEPAGWANRGLWFYRNNRLKEAGDDLRHAEELAPDDPDIQKLLGALDAKSGKYDAALTRFRRARSKKPNDLETLHALESLWDRVDDPRADRQRLSLLNEALAIQPNNLVLLSRKGHVAAGLKDWESLRQVVERYQRLAPAWSGALAQTARAYLEKLNKQAASPLPGDVFETLVRLDTLLTAENCYHRNVRDAGRELDIAAEPIRQFLRLPPMRSSPSPPDTGLEFVTASALKRRLVGEAVKQARWDVTLPVWLKQEDEASCLCRKRHRSAQGDGRRPGSALPRRAERDSANGARHPRG